MQLHANSVYRTHGGSLLRVTSIDAYGRVDYAVIEPMDLRGRRGQTTLADLDERIIRREVCNRPFRSLFSDYPIARCN